jgi:eukaryotic-like serine/threonine-protein kinase
MTDAVSGDVAATFPLRWDAPLGLLYIDGVSNNSRESVVVRTGSRVGHFRILGVLGRGGMGEVYEAFDETLQRRVALKTIRTDQRLALSARQRFLSEARMLSQLDHPGICRIYDYLEEGGSDLLVLELIEGETLRQSSEGLDFKGKLRIAQEIVDALAAAHRLGIVHRDLKPDNVMLTARGRVKILDFGLARVSAHEEEKTAATNDPLPDDPEPNHAKGDTVIWRDPAPKRSGSDTALGQAIGTPAYMSPEQARGETVTTASDMYSFGLVLQALFTGREPFEEGLTAREAIDRARRGESLSPVGIDRNIAALIRNLKRVAASDRPTALDVSKELDWIAGRTNRRIRRISVAAILVIVSLATLKYVSDVRHERNVAIEARADADRRRGQAEVLIGFMVGDLRTKLEPVGSLALLDDVGKHALAYFKSLRPDEISPQELRRNAKTLNQLGEVRMAQGDLAGAGEVLGSALELATAAAQRDPDDVENQLELGVTHFWLGSLRRQEGDLERALEQYTRYLRISEALARSAPENIDYQIEVAYGHSNVGTILEQQGELERALSHYTGAVEVKEQRLQREPLRIDWKADLATTVNKVGVVLLAMGRYLDARQAFEHEHDLLASALENEPKNTRRKHRMTVNLSFQGDLAEDLGDEKAAMELFTRGRQLERELVAHDAANTGWQRNLANSDLKVGRRFHQRGELEAANDALGQALARMQPLVAKDPARVLWRTDVASMHEAMASVLLDRGLIAEARGEMNAARESLAKTAESDRLAQRLALRLAVTTGVVAERAGDRAGARAEWTRVIESLWPSRESLRTVGDLDLLARALLHADRVQDAEPILERLGKLGYRQRDLMKLWEAKRNHRPSERAATPSSTLGDDNNKQSGAVVD